MALKMTLCRYRPRKKHDIFECISLCMGWYSLSAISAIQLQDNNTAVNLHVTLDPWRRVSTTVSRRLPRIWSIKLTLRGWPYSRRFFVAT